MFGYIPRGSRHTSPQTESLTRVAVSVWGVGTLSSSNSTPASSQTPINHCMIYTPCPGIIPTARGDTPFIGGVGRVRLIVACVSIFNSSIYYLREGQSAIPLFQYLQMGGELEQSTGALMRVTWMHWDPTV